MEQNYGKINGKTTTLSGQLFLGQDKFFILTTNHNKNYFVR
jgi:hypothetical protein